MQHVHAGWACRRGGKDMKYGPAARTCSMDMHENGWTFMDMQQGHAGQKSTDLYGYACTLGHKERLPFPAFLGTQEFRKCNLSSAILSEFFQTFSKSVIFF
jgi:hypothetical protein